MVLSKLTLLTTATAFALSMGFAVAQQGQTGTGTGAGSGTGTQTTTTRVPSADKMFMTKAAQGGMAEVELGQLAVQHGGNDAVKQFGQRMVDDHTNANNELMQLASQKQVTLPKSINKKDKTLKTHLSKLSGAAFDKQYMNDMVKDHQQDIAEFQKEADSGQDPDVKAFAAKTLPTLKMHLTMAESVRDGKGMPSDSSTTTGSANK